jgi:hypothetical protein
MNMVAGKQDSEILSEQAITLYKLLHEQVAFLKKQQWTITNYIALIYAAIFGLKKELSALPYPLKCILIAAVIVACVYGLIALGLIQFDLGKSRKRLDETERHIFGDKEYRELKLREEKHPYRRGMFFTGALMLLLVIGTVIVVPYLAS